MDNASELLRHIETLNLDKGIDKETIFRSVEEALKTAAQRRGGAGDDSDVDIHIDRQTGKIYAYRDGVPVEINEAIERTGAQMARQILQQNIREAVRTRTFEEYRPRVDELVFATVRRVERNGVIMTIDGDVDAFLPNENKIRGEIYRPGQEFATVIESVDREPKKLGEGKKRDGRRPPITLSRKSSKLLQRLFEQEVPEIKNGLIRIVRCARDPGKRAKIAVAASEEARMTKEEVLGACLGVRNSRCNNVSKLLGGDRMVEHVDVTLWSDDDVELIQNALKPARVGDVILCGRLDRAIVLVSPAERSRAIGKGGQNVTLAKKICEWELEILVDDENNHGLDDLLDQASQRFLQIPGMTNDIVEQVVGEGFTSFEDLACIELADMMELSGLPEDEAKAIVDYAADIVEKIERFAKVDGVNANLAERFVLAGIPDLETLKGVDRETLRDKVGLTDDEINELARNVQNYLRTGGRRRDFPRQRGL